jgi:hypothetical protein
MPGERGLLGKRAPAVVRDADCRTALMNPERAESWQIGTKQDKTAAAPVTYL